MAVEREQVDNPFAAGSCSVPRVMRGENGQWSVEFRLDFYIRLNDGREIRVSDRHVIVRASEQRGRRPRPVRPSPDLRQVEYVDDFELCADCPPVGYPTDKTRCAECPRLETGTAPRAPTTCGYCSYEEADGELIEQCAKCKAAAIENNNLKDIEIERLRAATEQGRCEAITTPRHYAEPHRCPFEAKEGERFCGTHLRASVNRSAD